MPVREFACDRNNVYGGQLRFFWNVGRPLILGDAAILVLHKVGAMGAGFFAQSEGALLRSRNILTERNPAWLMAGVERATPQGRIIEWSQPEIALYDDDPFIRMSFPDLIEEDGKFYITETQKNLGRVHEIPAPLVDGLFQQF